MKTFFISALLILLSYNKMYSNMEVVTQNNQFNKWVNYFNDQFDALGQTYSDRAFIINKEGEVIIEKTNIINYQRIFKKQIETIQSYAIIAQKNVSLAQNVRYEISTFNTDSGNQFKHLVIYETTENTEWRLFEIIAQCDSATACTSKLNQRRIEWAKWAGSHQVSNFINDLYSGNAVYYYQSANDLRIGTQNIIEVYGYMNDPNFQFDKLEAIHCEPVNSHLFFEIGTWTIPGSQGEYVIVWQLCPDNVWRILFDSNY